MKFLLNKMKNVSIYPKMKDFCEFKCYVHFSNLPLYKNKFRQNAISLQQTKAKEVNFQ